MNSVAVLCTICFYVAADLKICRTPNTSAYNAIENFTVTVNSTPHRVVNAIINSTQIFWSNRSEANAWRRTFKGKDPHGKDCRVVQYVFHCRKNGTNSTERWKDNRCRGFASSNDAEYRNATILKWGLTLPNVTKNDSGIFTPGRYIWKNHTFVPYNYSYRLRVRKDKWAPVRPPNCSHPYIMNSTGCLRIRQRSQ